MKRLATLAILTAAAAFTAAGQFTITTTSVGSAVLGQPYAPAILQTSGDPGPITWNVIAGALPQNFVVGPGPAGQPTAGTFCYGVPAPAGGPPNCFGTGVQSLQGVYNFTVQATSQSTAKTATQQYTMAVYQPVQITTTTLPVATANQAYVPPNGFQLVTTGGTGQFTWSLTAGALPPGIGLSATGILSGIAPNSTANYTFTVQVLDQVTQTTATQTLTLIVTGGLQIITTSLPNGTLNQSYTPFQLQGSGAKNPVWSLQQGSQLPVPFNLSPSGLLTGFGQSLGTFKFNIQFMDQDQPGVAVQTFTFYITLGPLGIGCPSCPQAATLPYANQNVAYRATLVPQGGIPPYTFSFDVANPQGLSINTTTGAISGTPSNAGAFPIPVTLKDSVGEVFSQTFSLNVFAAVSISTASLPNGSPGVSYSTTLTATGGSIPYSNWTVIAGSLPPGLTLNPATGQISGTPTTQGTYQFTVQVTDSVPGTASKVLSITIGSSQPLTITTTSLPDGVTNQTYSQTLGATGGASPYTWSVGSGNLPAGLLLNTATGVISGTPTSVGNVAFVVVVTDAQQSVARQNLSINIANAANAVVITTVSLPNGTLNQTYSQTLIATGGAGPPYAWTISSGTLPAGLQLNGATGVISGTPTAAGTSQITFTATDARGQTGSKTISITIILPPAPPASIALGSTTQPGVSLTTGAPYPLDITGILTLTFASSIGSPDGMEARFVNGGRSLQFTVPANTTQANFSGATNPAVMTGTVAGTITLKASLSASGQDITPSPAPTKTITINPAVPVILSVALQQVTGGINVVVEGYSNTREVSSGSFTFTVSSGNTLSQAQFTVTLTSAYATWFNSTASNATGGQFKLTVPFNVTGSATAVTKVTVTLTNGQGPSAAASSP